MLETPSTPEDINYYTPPPEELDEEDITSNTRHEINAQLSTGGSTPHIISAKSTNPPNPIFGMPAIEESSSKHLFSQSQKLRGILIN